MILRTLFVCLLLSAALVRPAASAPARPPAPDVTVVVRPGESDGWTATFTFRRSAPAWLFPRTNPTADGLRNWRLDSWRVETPGVRLVRRGQYDVLESADGRPIRSVRVRFTPFTEGLRADYTPVLAFTDGGRAIYTGQYEMIPLARAEIADDLPADLNGRSDLTGAAGRFTVEAPGRRLLVGGVASRGRAQAALDAGVYVYVGDGALVETAALAAVVDPGLPAWLHDELKDFTPRLLALYAERLGPRGGVRPTVYAAWVPSQSAGYSLGGSVLDGLVVMQMSGKGLNDSDPRVRNLARWFLAHETAHFWAGQEVRYARGDEGWITEGAADLMAVRALQRMDPGYDAGAPLQGAVDECLKLLGPGESIAGALPRNEHRVSYVCGATLLLAFEAAERRRDPGADVFTVWRALIDANRADRTVDTDDWLAAFARTTGDPELAADVGALIRTGVSDPASVLRGVFDRTGVPYRLEDGRIVLSPAPSA